MYAAGKAPLRAVVGANSAESESRASMLQDASFLCARRCQQLQSYLLFWQRRAQHASSSSIVSV